MRIIVMIFFISHSQSAYQEEYCGKHPILYNGHYVNHCKCQSAVSLRVDFRTVTIAELRTIESSKLL